MAQATRVLVIGDDRNNTLNTAITAGGYEQLNPGTGMAGQTLNDHVAPDVLIFNLFGLNSQDDKSRYIDIAKQFKSSGAEPKSLLILVGPGTQIDDEFSKQYGWLFDEILIDPVNEEQIRRRINSLVRLNNMNQELLRRLKTIKKFGIDAPEAPRPPENIVDANILILGATRDFALIEKALSSQATLVGALSCTTALDYLGRRPFEMVIVNLPDAPGDVEEFCRSARRNPNLYDLPILILGDNELSETANRVIDAGATGNLPHPLDTEEFRSRVMGLISEARFRETLRETYDNARHLATSDSLTGLYSRGFLQDHLATVLADCDHSKPMFAVAFFELKNITEINEAFGYVAGDRIIRQVGSMMGKLVRAEDLMARYSGDKFVAVMPNTTPEAAQVALNRITGVINFTEFLVCEDRDLAQADDIIRVQISSGVTDILAGDTPETIIERAQNICFTGG